MKERMVIIGAGGHSHVIADILLQDEKYEVVGLVDNNPQAQVLGFRVLGDDTILPKLFSEGVTSAFVAIGNNSLRKKITKALQELGFSLPCAISHGAIISKFGILGKGVAVMPGAILNAGAVVGDGCILNTNCSVDHHCQIGDFTHIAPGATIAGGVSVGEGCFLGAGCRVIDSMSIGSNTIVGAGAAVIRALPCNCTAVGVPAKVIKQN